MSDFIEFLFQKAEAKKGKEKSKSQDPPIREAGTLKGMITYMSDDFDAPLEDFKDYM